MTRKNIKTLLSLKINNPELEIKFAVDKDILDSEDYSDYIINNFKSVSIELYYETGDEIYIGEQKIKEYLIDYYCFTFDSDTDKEFDRLYYKGEFKQAIFIFVGV